MFLPLSLSLYVLWFLSPKGKLQTVLHENLLAGDEEDDLRQTEWKWWSRFFKKGIRVFAKISALEEGREKTLWTYVYMLKEQGSTTISQLLQTFIKF